MLVAESIKYARHSHPDDVIYPALLFDDRARGNCSRSLCPKCDVTHDTWVARPTLDTWVERSCTEDMWRLGQDTSQCSSRSRDLELQCRGEGPGGHHPGEEASPRRTSTPVSEESTLNICSSSEVASPTRTASKQRGEAICTKAEYCKVNQAEVAHVHAHDVSRCGLAYWDTRENFATCTYSQNFRKCRHVINNTEVRCTLIGSREVSEKRQVVKDEQQHRTTVRRSESPKAVI